MKKLLLFLMVGLLGVIISSCDSTDDPVTPDETGKIFINSTPDSAQIWVDNTNTGKLTADTISNLSVGDHQVRLVLAGYIDTTFTVVVTANQTSSRNIILVAEPSLTNYTSVRLWETSGTGPSQPSGLDLSLGMAFGITSSNNGQVDIYYSSAGTGGETYLVQSADLDAGMTRVTKFRVGSASNLDDGIDSPLLNSGTWTTNMDDREPNYVYLYDNDGHYSKIKITNTSLPGVTPSWVELTWWYNSIAGDPRF